MMMMMMILPEAAPGIGLQLRPGLAPLPARPLTRLVAGHPRPRSRQPRRPPVRAPGNNSTSGHNDNTISGTARGRGQVRPRHGV